MKYTFIVDNCARELSDFLKSMGVSQKLITRLRKEFGLMRVNGESVFSNCKVSKGDEVEIFVDNKTDKIVATLDAKVNIVFEDEHLCVIDKQSGLAVLPTHLHFEHSLQNALASIWGSDFKFHPVTRLDKDTSGLMIVAKNSFIHNEFVIQLNNKTIKKTYYAAVEGKLTGKGEIDFPICDNPIEHRQEVNIRGKQAITQFEVEKSFENATLVRINLLTGRTHQIRVHFSYIGHPLLGDKLYGGKLDLLERQFLHSTELTFLHPITHKMMFFKSTFPKDLCFVLENLEVLDNERTDNKRH